MNERTIDQTYLQNARLVICDRSHSLSQAAGLVVVAVKKISARKTIKRLKSGWLKAVQARVELEPQSSRTSSGLFLAIQHAARRSTYVFPW
jgi:hypothetical protein